VHALGRADDAVHRAGIDAQSAPDAPVFVDQRQAARAFSTADGIQRQRRLARESGQPFDAFLATRRTTVDRSLIVGNRFGVATAIGVAATGALGLRQRVVDARDP